MKGEQGSNIYFPPYLFSVQGGGVKVEVCTF